MADKSETSFLSLIFFFFLFSYVTFVSALYVRWGTQKKIPMENGGRDQSFRH